MGSSMWNRSVSASWVSVVAVLATILSRVPSLYGLTSGHCAIVGGRINTDVGVTAGHNFGNVPYPLDGTPTPTLYYSLGAEIFASKHSLAMNAATDSYWFARWLQPGPTINDKGCGYTVQSWSDGHMFVHLCPDMDNQPVDIKVYAVHEFKEGRRRVLSGWLHAEVELKTPNDTIEWIYLQMRDEYFNAIGEFVAEVADQCPPTVPDKFVQHTKFQVLPCTAIGQREAKVATALFMVKAEELTENDNRKYLPKEELKTGIHFTWRYSEYWCSRHLQIRPDLFMLTTIQKNNYETRLQYGLPYRVLRKAAEYWLRPAWFGVADIRVPSSKLVCNESVIEFKNQSGNAGKVYTSVAPWLTNQSHIYKYFEDYYQDFYEPPPGRLKTMFSCRTNYTNESLTFGGRCIHLRKQGAARTQLQGCNLDVYNNASEFEGIRGKFQKYGDYRVQLIVNRTGQCQAECIYPSSTNIDKISHLPPYPDDFHAVGPTLQNLTTSKSSVARFIRGRRYHGIVSVFATMFFTPVSIFSARYYKETFMKWQSEGCHIWFWVHLGAILMSMFLYLSSLSALTQSISNWGRSMTDAGHLHTGLGWLSHGIFFLLLILGGYRMGVKPGSRAMRIMIMTLHSLLGIFSYFTNIGMIVNSMMIPNSPSLNQCNDIDGLPEGVSAVAIIAVSWLCIDVVFHIVLTLLQFLQDKRVGIKRGWYCPIIPILPADSQKDFKGKSLRQVLFGIYVCFSFGFAISAVGVLAANDITSVCQFGPMSCNTSQHPFGCSNLAKKFASLVLEGD